MREQWLRGVPAAAAALAALCCGAVLTPIACASTQEQRQKLAEHAIGINMAFYEAQRAGAKPADSETLFPNIWEWKEPGYENMCSELMKTIGAADRAQVNMTSKAGYFEAGNAVIVTGPMAFSATQMAIGALQFMPLLGSVTAGDAFGDPAGCLKGGYTTESLKDLFLRQIRYFGATISNAMLVTRADNSNFTMLVGVADSDTYGDIPYPSWDAPEAYRQKCYVADMTHPAADVAAQAAAGLAMAAKVLATYGTAADAEAAAEYGVKAARAYEYAKEMYRKHGIDSICFRSSAVYNCIGSGCTKIEEDGDPVLSPCMLYLNKKEPIEYLFVAAAALYALTGRPYYRGDADSMWPQGPLEAVTQSMYLYNWNNILAQGVVILAAQPDLPGAARPREFYRNRLRDAAELWSRCSNEGEAVANYYRFCECAPYKSPELRTPGGSAYPLDFPWGNLGTAMNGMCAVGMYQMLGFDAEGSAMRKGAACTMQRQLGYIFNHKCTTEASSCNTQGPDGYSYMVGIGRYFPTKVHSRDASYPHFYDNNVPNPGTLCGGLVSGPYARNAPTDGPVRNGTDIYENDRRKWQASEAAIDYTSSLVCTLMAYATMPDSLFEGCDARSPFTGRGI